MVHSSRSLMEAGEARDWSSGTFPRRFVPLLLNEPGLRPNDAIFLYSCNLGGGKVSFGVKLSQGTGRAVIASTDVLWYGGPESMQPHNRDNFSDSLDLGGRGEMKIFLPDDPIPNGWERIKRPNGETAERVSLPADGSWSGPPGPEGGPATRRGTSPPRRRIRRTPYRTTLRPCAQV